MAQTEKSETTCPSRHTYAKCWKALCDWLDTPDATPRTRPERLASTDLQEYLTTYEMEVLKAIGPLVKEVESILGCPTEDCPFSIGRAIVHLNSCVWNRRIRMPLVGQQLQQEEPDIQAEWLEKAQKRDGRNRMFFMADKPVHLLTEAMWRFQSLEQWGTGQAFALVYQDTCWSGICEEELPFLAIDRNGDVNEDYLKTLLQRLERLRKTHEATCIVKCAPYDPESSDLNIIRRPITLMDEHKGTQHPIECIFYLPDVVETEYLAGTDMEIFLREGADGVTASQLKTFLKKAQWIVHRYIIQIVSAAERKYIEVGEAYPRAYFSGSGLAVLIGALRESKAEATDTAVIPILDAVIHHFELAESPRGIYWRGYGGHSHAVACAVADIMTELFPKCGVLCRDFAELPLRVRNWDVHLSNIDEDLKRTPFFVRQLFRGLQGEGTLFTTDEYREHFVHSFHVFVYGLILLFHRPRNVIPKTIPARVGISYLRQWFMVAMWHDIAYGLQKIEDLVGTIVRRLTDKDPTQLLPIQPSLGHLLQVREVASGIFVTGPKWREGILQGSGVRGEDEIHRLIARAAFERQDHGFWSACLAHTAIHRKDGRLEDHSLACLYKDEFGGSQEDTVAKAILPHHLSNWGCPGGSTGGATIRIDTHNNPLAYLLGLVDMLAQSGREAPESPEGQPSDLGITLRSLKRRDDGSLEFELHYKQPPGNLRAKDILEKYFVTPAKHLSLEGIAAGNSDVLVVRIATSRGRGDNDDQGFTLIEDEE